MYISIAGLVMAVILLFGAAEFFVLWQASIGKPCAQRIIDKIAGY